MRRKTGQNNQGHFVITVLALLRRKSFAWLPGNGGRQNMREQCRAAKGAENPGTAYFSSITCHDEMELKRCPVDDDYGDERSSCGMMLNRLMPVPAAAACYIHEAAYSLMPAMSHRHGSVLFGIEGRQRRRDKGLVR